MRERRRRRIDPQRAQEAVMGRIYQKVEKKECGECGELRNSVDDSGLCGYCRAVLIVRK